MLYPIQNDRRNLQELSGIWDFQTDPGEEGEMEGWFNGLPDPLPIAVPGSWNEQYADLYNYFGMGWYVRELYIPQGWRGQRIWIRVGSANYFARMWVNGAVIGEHAGGHLPFDFDITGQVRWDAPNTVAIQVENHLMPNRVPAGNVESSLAGLMAGHPNTTFDFFPYTGLHRPVVIYSVPEIHIEDVTIRTDIEGDDGKVTVRVTQNRGSGSGRVTLWDGNQFLESAMHFESGEAEANLSVPAARLWSADDPHLYQCAITLVDSLADGHQVVDRYALDVGIRTIAVQGNQILLNGQPVYLKGFGRHEDFYVHGRGLNVPLIVKDYDLLKWVGANSYRTSHYPYSEEEMRMADRQGILIIDEIPAVGLQFNDGSENIQTRLGQCKQQLRELVQRDKNHPSVIMWSIANEPVPPKMIERFAGEQDEPVDPGFARFFKALYDLARSLDPTRLVTLVGVMGGPLEWLAPSDVICINRYWGWYTQPGQPELGAQLLGQELDSLYEVFQKPIMVSEFGADTVHGMHSHPPKMWTEEYQAEFIRGYLDVADTKDFVVGMHVWNYADFQAVQSTSRVGGMNLKGVFTRDRVPKMAAHLLRERWALSEAPVKADPKRTVSRDTAAELSIEQILNRLANELDGKRPGLTKTLKFDLGEEGVYRIVITNGRTRLETGDGEADATMRVKPKDALKIFTGKLNPMIAVTTGKIRLSGDAMAFMVLQELQ
jgi:beta-glucuronidase